MATLIQTLAFLSIALSIITPSSSTSTTSIDFIKTSCKATLYPSLCIQSLSSYASKIHKSNKHLTLTALYITLSRARSARTYMAKLTKVRGIKHRELMAVRDCQENMNDTVDLLSRSMKELAQLGRDGFGEKFVWHMDNVKTWVSAALTNENSCLDGFTGRVMEGNIKVAVKHRVDDIDRVTSNALALVNQFASKYSSTDVNKN